MLIHDKPNLITELDTILEDCVTKNEGLTHLLLASREGLPMLSTDKDLTLPEETLAVINATSVYHGQMILNELQCGNIKELYVKGDEGVLILFPVGEEASLLGLATNNGNLREILLEMRRAAKLLLLKLK
ncbi:MAG: roadblock/LC7 domain-containing protein [Candidatus Hodarchaeales archaeon]|jgi:predicted regulator of Ras-like GTPase activity (Roadblock/LC7/MglB family)